MISEGSELRRNRDPQPGQEDGAPLADRPRRRGLSPLWRNLLSIAFSAGLLLVALNQIQSNGLLEALASLDLGIAATLTLLAIVRILAVAQRWRLLLLVMAQDPGLRTSLRLTYEGALLNGFLPGSIAGDPYRILQVRALGTSLANASFATLLDRAVGVVTLAFLGLAGIPAALWASGSGSLPATVMLGISGVVLFSFLVTLGLLFADRLPLDLPVIGDWTRRELPTVRASLRRFPKAPLQAVAIIALSVLGHLALALMFVVPLAAMAPEVSMAATLAMGFAISMAQLLPFSVGGWGARELAAVSGFGLIGILGSNALATSIAVGAVSSLILVPALLLFLLPRRQGQAIDVKSEPGKGTGTSHD